MPTQSVRLSTRLQFIFESLKHSMDVWDICCDHGYLGLAAWQSKNFKNIFLVDQVPHLIENLKNKFSDISKEDSSSKIHFQCLSGEKIDQDIYGNIVIAGVGAHTICDILISLQKENHLKANRLILCPHRHTDTFLEILKQTGLKNYSLKSKNSVIENGKERIIFIFDLI